MTATTYSPKLGLYETDANSSFTLPFELTLPGRRTVRDHRRCFGRRRRGQDDVERSERRTPPTNGVPSSAPDPTR